MSRAPIAPRSCAPAETHIGSRCSRACRGRIPRTLAIFDFDKTLVARDSFRLFGGLGASGPAERALLFGYAALARIGVILEHPIQGPRAATSLATAPGSSARRSAHPGAGGSPGTRRRDDRHRVRAHLSAVTRVAVLTASPEFYIGPFLADISPAIELHGSQVEERDGKIRVENLYGKRKAAVAGILISEIQPGPRPRLHRSRARHRTDEARRLGLARPTQGGHDRCGREGRDRVRRVAT